MLPLNNLNWFDGWLVYHVYAKIAVISGQIESVSVIPLVNRVRSRAVNGNHSKIYGF